LIILVKNDIIYMKFIQNLRTYKYMRRFRTKKVVIIMKKQKYFNKIEKIFKKNKGYARTKDIVNAGIHKYYLYLNSESNKKKFV